MPDDVTITKGANSTPPDGTVVATDLVSGAHYQRVKVAIGADGAVSGDLAYGQQVMAGSLPVVVASDQIVNTEEQEVVPTDASKNNPIYALSYTGSNLTQVDMTIGAAVYRKTLGYDGSDNLTSVSAWAAV